ncbi:MAG: hypothetical protein LCH96_18495 [Actinobacteria bacterium]|jgi:hypothetical protein|nr:hypothetical protein [Actinomycetota bacterium]
MTTSQVHTHAALRTWAKGIYPLEAGVELLIRTSDGRFAASSQPWIQPGDHQGWWWVDADQLTDDNLGALSGGEARMLRIAASLLGGVPVSLHEAVPGLDRDHVELVLAAIAHASGSHEHAGPPRPDPEGRYRSSDGTRMAIPRLGSLYPWPDPA